MADHCKSCGAPITWAISAKGKAIPIDPSPVKSGNLVLIVEDPRNAPTARYARDEEGPRYVSHFATCAQADEHRRKQ